MNSLSESINRSKKPSHKTIHISNSQKLSTKSKIAKEYAFARTSKRTKKS